ncbi:DUF4349 domain-containing protein [Streptomyces sp. NPDC018693]|uniref:DUF4349 domain-containing protein n=1 Tax=unclassified Streptomyces TaxID=2593676 RepID=UPI003796836F
MRTRHPVRHPARVLAGLLLAVGLALTGCAGDADDGGGSSGSAARGLAGDEAADLGAEAGTREDTAEGAGSDGARSEPEAGARASAAPALTVNRIIRTATLTVQVKDVPKALEQARAATEDAGGYVGDETTTRDEDGSEHTRVVLRVPVDKYEAVLTGLQGTGKLVERTAKAQDVTDQVVDVDSRVQSQRASVARVRELMERATQLSDVLALEGELSNRQAELESLLARQASLKDRTTLATITLTLDENPVREKTEDDEPGFLDALSGGWDAFVAMLRWVAMALGAVLPFAAVALLLAVVWRRLVRPRLRRAAPPAPAPAVPGPLPTAPPVTALAEEERGDGQD